MARPLVPSRLRRLVSVSALLLGIGGLAQADPPAPGSAEATSNAGASAKIGTGGATPIEAVLIEGAALARAGERVATEVLEAAKCPACCAADDPKCQPSRMVIVLGSQAELMARYRATIAEGERLLAIFACAQNHFACPDPSLRSNESGKGEEGDASLAKWNAAATALETLLGTAQKAFSLFQSSFELVGNTSGLSRASLLAAVAGPLSRCECLDTRVPSQMMPMNTSSSALLGLLRAGEAARLDALICPVGKEYEPVLAKALKDWDALIAELATQANAAPRIAQLLVVEELAEIAKEARLVVVDVEKSGSSSKAASSPMLGASASFSGGAVLTYYVFEPGGRLVTSGLVPAYTGLLKARKLERTLVDGPPAHEPAVAYERTLRRTIPR